MKVSIYHAKTHLSELIKEALKGTTVIIARGQKPLVKIVPLEAEDGPWSCLGAFEGKITMMPGFNDPLDEFKEYMPANPPQKKKHK